MAFRFCRKLVHFNNFSVRIISTVMRYSSSFKNFRFSKEVSFALSNNIPIVALESAVITHGMPYPHSMETALELESIIRQKEVVPATIAVLDGQVHVGLNREEHAFLAQVGEKVKISRRDLPFVLSKRLHGGTTVSGTMLLAHLCGIKFFVTGGIGGVHRGAESSFDISADLTELGRTPLAVVCAGVKSILDVPKTLEYLETQGVCVCVVGPNRRFPDFFTNDSGVDAHCCVEGPLEAASVVHKQEELGLQSGVVFAVPIPVGDQAEGHDIKNAIESAVVEASKSVSGKDVTPFILNRVKEITNGRSLSANISLLKNNAAVGAQIALEHSKLGPTSTHVRKVHSGSKPDGTSPYHSPVVIGGSIYDITVKVLDSQIKMNGSTHLGSISSSFGGVGRNVADALTLLGCFPLFISAVAMDSRGASILNHNQAMDRRGIAKIEGSSTPTYTALLDHKGNVLTGIGDMALHNKVTPAWIENFREDILRSPLVIMDGNISLEAMEKVMEICEEGKTPLWYEPTDVKKATKPWLITRKRSSLPLFMSPNLEEFFSIMDLLSGSEVKRFKCFEGEDMLEAELKQLVTLSETYFPSLRGIMITLGSHGFLFVRRTTSNPDSPLALAKDEQGEFVGTYFGAPKDPAPVSSSGAGDCLAAGFIAGLLRGERISSCSSYGLAYARMSLARPGAVPHVEMERIFRRSRQNIKIVQ